MRLVGNSGWSSPNVPFTAHNEVKLPGALETPGQLQLILHPQKGTPILTGIVLRHLPKKGSGALKTD